MVAYKMNQIATSRPLCGRSQRYIKRVPLELQDQHLIISNVASAELPEIKRLLAHCQTETSQALFCAAFVLISLKCRLPNMRLVYAYCIVRACLTSLSRSRDG